MSTVAKDPNIFIGWMMLNEFQYINLSKLPGLMFVPEDLAKVVYNALIHIPAILKAKRPLPILDVIPELSMEELHEKI